jgi:hypothetical protein
MGRIAAELSDVVIVTSDNPRTEPPQQIITEIIPADDSPTGKPIIVHGPLSLGGCSVKGAYHRLSRTARLLRRSNDAFASSVRRNPSAPAANLSRTACKRSCSFSPGAASGGR